MAEEVIVEAVETGEDTGVSRVYELGYHIIPTVKEEEIEGAVGAIRSVIEQAGGSFIAEGAPALVKLAYPMIAREGEKQIEHDRGYFGWLKFEAQVSVVRVLDEALKANPTVLRHMIFKTVREETRARIKAPTLREVKPAQGVRTSPRREDEVAAPVSEADLDKALQEITNE